MLNLKKEIASVVKQINPINSKLERIEDSMKDSRLDKMLMGH